MSSEVVAKEVAPETNLPENENVEDEVDDNENAHGAPTDPAKKRKKKKKKTVVAASETADVNDVQVLTENLEKAKIEGEKGEGDEEEDEAAEGGDGTTAEKKKKKKKKKKAGAESGVVDQPKPAKKQTNPPSIPINELYPDGNFPVGQILDYPVPKDMQE
jgi:methionyl aminopeptidase